MGKEDKTLTENVESTDNQKAVSKFNPEQQSVIDVEVKRILDERQAASIEAGDFTVVSVDENEVRLSHDQSVSNMVLRKKGLAKALNRGDVVDVVLVVRKPPTEEKVTVQVPVSDVGKLPSSAEPLDKK